MSQTPTLEWLGCATFRVRIGELVLFFDTFVDRIAAASSVGVSSEEVEEADFLFISHSHLDHLLGADTIAVNTGAAVIGSHETMRVMADCGVPSAQRWAVSGGERIDCGGGVSVTVLPSLHSCLWAPGSSDATVGCIGELDVSYQQRSERTAAAVAALHTLTPEVERYLGAHDGRASRSDGGQLVYLLQTAAGSVLFSSSAGCWSGIFRDLRPDLAILAVAGRPNLDGEPFQGSLAQFVAAEVALLDAGAVAFCHHDAWMPPLPPIDVTPIVAELAARMPAVAVLELALAQPTAVLGS